MKAARLYGYKDVRIKDVELPHLDNTEIKIEVEWCGICGSDKHSYTTQDTPFPLPVTLGHEFSGVVNETGKSVTRLKRGDRVVVNPIYSCGKCANCRRGYPNLCENISFFGYNGTSGAFAEYAVVNENMVYKIPDSLPMDEAAISEPAAVALHAIRISNFKPGNTAVVYGAGPIGLLLISLLKASGAKEIISVGHTESRRNQAIKSGATRTIDPDSEDPKTIIYDLTEGGADIVFDLAGAQETFTSGLSVLKARGEFVFVSLPQSAFQFDVYKALSKEIKITTSQCTIDEFPIIIDMLAKKSFNIEGIITKKISLLDIVEDGFEKMLKDKSQLKILVGPKIKPRNS